MHNIWLIVVSGPAERGMTGAQSFYDVKRFDIVSVVPQCFCTSVALQDGLHQRTLPPRKLTMKLCM